MAILIAVLCLSTDEKTEHETRWLSGKQVKNAAQVEISGQWSESPLRNMLIQISQSKHIPLFIDRRVDPGLSIDLTASRINWEQLLSMVGRPYGYGFCRLDDVYYFGPEETAVCLPGQFEKLKAWTKKNRGQADVDWWQPVSMQWPRLSQPAELLSDMSRQYEFEFHDKQLPLDVWAVSDIPNVSLLLKTALFSVGFDKWVLISKSGSKIKLVDFPVPKEVVYKISNLENAKRAASELGQMFGGIKIRTVGNSLTLSGSVNDLKSAIAKAVDFQRVHTSRPGGESVFTAEFKGKRGSVLATMASQLGLKLKFDQGIAELLSQHIEFDVVDAPADQIIRQSLQGTGLGYRIDSTQLDVYRK